MSLTKSMLTTTDPQYWEQRYQEDTAKWDIGMAVQTDYRALGYEVGDIVGAMVKDGTLAKIFAAHHAEYEVPAYYTE